MNAMCLKFMKAFILIKGSWPETCIKMNSIGSLPDDSQS